MVSILVCTDFLTKFDFSIMENGVNNCDEAFEKFSDLPHLGLLFDE